MRNVARCALEVIIKNVRGVFDRRRAQSLCLGLRRTDQTSAEIALITAARAKSVCGSKAMVMATPWGSLYAFRSL